MSTTVKSSYSNPSDDQYMKILQKRRMGIWHADETRKEAVVSWHDLESSDIGMCIHMASGLFNKMNNSELKQHIKLWKKNKCKCRESNLRELTLDDGTKVWSMCIQPPDSKVDDCQMCPLGLAHGFLVSGYCYFVKSKDICDKVVKALA